MGRRNIHFVTPSEVESARARVKNWGGICILCGESFKSILSVTKDHVIPKCMVKIPKEQRVRGDNFCAATHYRCNNLRLHNSIIKTAKTLAEIKEKWGHEKFYDWVNKHVPCRKAEPGMDISC